MRSLITPNTLANEVRLKRTQFLGTFLLVEGSDDSRFYKRFVDLQQCQLILALNKENVINAVCLLDASNFHGVIGFVDSDFDILNGTALPSPNIVRGDCHDVESMLIRSPALEAVLHEFSSPAKLTDFELRFGASFRDWLIQTSRCLGYLRFYSLTTGLHLSFNGLRFPNFIDAQTLQLDRAALLTEIKNRSQNWDVSDAQLIAAGWPADSADDPWQVCCGHDLVDLLTLALRRAIGSQAGLATEQVARGLRLAYSQHDFIQSELHMAVRQWEARRGIQILARIP